MILLRRVLGDALRARRQAQHRTLREVSGAANVSLGYLSEIERGQKEASSELLSAICVALGAHLSEVLRDVSETLEFAELTESGMLAPGRNRLTPAGVGGRFVPAESGMRGPVDPPEADGRLARTGVGGRLTPSGAGAAVVPSEAAGAQFAAAASEFAPPAPRESGGVTNFVGAGAVSVAVRRDGPLKTTLRATRTGGTRREAVRAA